MVYKAYTFPKKQKTKTKHNCPEYDMEHSGCWADERPLVEY